VSTHLSPVISWLGAQVRRAKWVPDCAGISDGDRPPILPVHTQRVRPRPVRAIDVAQGRRPPVRMVHVGNATGSGTYIGDLAHDESGALRCFFVRLPDRRVCNQCAFCS